MSSQPWSAIDPEAVLDDADSVMLLLDGESGSAANKRATLATLKSFIVDQTASVPIFSGVDDDVLIQIGDTLFPLSGNSSTGTTDESTIVQITPIAATYRNLTVVVTANNSTQDFDVELVEGNTGVLIATVLAGQSGNFQSTTSATIAANQPVFLRVKGVVDGSNILINGISCTVDVPISGGLATEFTWGASDEDSPLITGILYTTEASNVTKPISQVILTLKNSPTNNPIQVNIIQEDGPNSNSFPVGNTIFSTEPQIKDFEFTSLGGDVPGAIAGGTFSWVEGNRLQILLTTNDNNNFAATGLKVSLL